MFGISFTFSCHFIAILFSCSVCVRQWLAMVGDDGGSGGDGGGADFTEWHKVRYFT